MDKRMVMEALKPYAKSVAAREFWRRFPTMSEDERVALVMTEELSIIETLIAPMTEAEKEEFVAGYLAGVSKKHAHELVPSKYPYTAGYFTGISRAT